MKRTLLMMVAFTFLASTALFGAQPSANNGRQVRQVDSPTETASALPTISKFQMPGVVPNLGCAGAPDTREPCTQDDGSGGGTGYTSGGCNCSRICYDYVSTCALADPNIGCTAGSNGALCTSCSGQCYRN